MKMSSGSTQKKEEASEWEMRDLIKQQEKSRQQHEKDLQDKQLEFKKTNREVVNKKKLADKISKWEDL